MELSPDMGLLWNVFEIIILPLIGGIITWSIKILINFKKEYVDYRCKLEDKLSLISTNLQEHTSRLDSLDADREVQNEQIKVIQQLSITVAKLDTKLDIIVPNYTLSKHRVP